MYTLGLCLLRNAAYSGDDQPEGTYGGREDVTPIPKPYKIKQNARKNVYVRCRLSIVSRVCVILLSKIGRENMRLYRNDSNTWKVTMDAKTNSSHTHIDFFVHHGTCLHGYARSRVGYCT